MPSRPLLLLRLLHRVLRRPLRRHPRAAAGVLTLLLTGFHGVLLVGLPSCTEGGGGGAVETTWDLARLPEVGPTLREVRTPSGATVRVLAEGTGPAPAPAEAIDVRYDGRLLSGRSFDAGVLPGVEIGATPRRLIAGFDEGLAGIRLGERRRLLIPAHLAYGSSAQGAIPPNSPLVFDVERIALAVETLDLRDGTGAEARMGSEITVHYKGTLKNGTVFDSSMTSGKPATFKLARGRLIEGWIRGIPGMKVGGLRVLKVPSDLAYGKQGKPPKIPADAPLQFEIELLDVR